MPDERDHEIVELLVALGTSRKTAMRQLATTRDKPAKLRRLREEKRLINLRSERDKKKEEAKRWAREGRENLQDALTAARREARAASEAGHPVRRLAEGLGRMWLHEAGPVRAASLSPTAGRGGESDNDGPPGTWQPAIGAQEWEKRLARVATVLEHDLRLIRGEATAFAGKGLEQRILGYEGESVAFIAYVEDVDVRQIQRLCRAARDRGDNYRVKGGRLVREELEMPAAA